MNSKIDWAKNYRGHASTAQNSIMHCLQMLADFEAVDVNIDGFDEQSVTSGQSDFYAFMKKLYLDLYEHPEQYAVPTAAYDAYMRTVDPDEYYATNGHKKTDGKEGRLRQEFQDAIAFYPDYFYQLGLAADTVCTETYALVLSKAKYKAVLQALDDLHKGKENAQRTHALANLGIAVTERDEAYDISCIQHPKLFLGLRVLCVQPENPYKYMNYLRLDFKGYQGRIPAIEDILRTMDEEHAAVLCPLVASLDHPKMKTKLHPLKSITSNHKWKVEYVLNSKRVFEFYAGPAYLVIHIFFRDTESLTSAVQSIYATDPAFFAWLDGRFKEKLCDCPRNKTVQFGDHQKRICSSTNQVEIMNPNQDDMERSIELIKILNRQ